MTKSTGIGLFWLAESETMTCIENLVSMVDEPTIGKCAFFDGPQATIPTASATAAKDLLPRIRDMRTFFRPSLSPAAVDTLAFVKPEPAIVAGPG
jgi:hypothetical protein